MDRHDLYEACVQNPPVLAALLRRLHGNHPERLAEDFCGTAALSRAWVRRAAGDSQAHAVCLDADPLVIGEARARAGADPTVDPARMEFVISDAMSAPTPGAPGDGADVISVANFSIGEIHERSSLVRYLTGARLRLREGGVFVCDTYGGESAWRTGAVRRVHHLRIDGDVPSAEPASRSTRIHYTWEQRAADPFTARVVNALHFRVEVGGEIVQEHTDAFVYHWRVWSVPELRDAMRESGFATTAFTTDLEPQLAPGAPLQRTGADSDAFAACVVGRT